MTTIRGAKIMLRPAEESDRRAVYEWLAQSDVTRSMMGPPFFSDALLPTWDEFREDYGPEFFDGTRQEIVRSYIIVANGEAVGHVNYEVMERAPTTAELDIWLRSEQFCGRGYGPDALVTLTGYLNETLGITEFIIRPSRRNSRAVHAYSKAGFELLPLTNEQQTETYGPGDYADAVVMRKGLPRASTGSACPGS